MELEGHQRGTIVLDLNLFITLLGCLILRNKLEMGPQDPVLMVQGLITLHF